MALPLADSMTSLMLAALAAALLGGWHCAGMCGAIASLATHRRAVFFYQIGRFVAYLFLGALASFAGGRLLERIDLRQHWAVGIIMAALSFWILSSTWKMPLWQSWQRFVWRHRPRGMPGIEYLSLGLLNGFLPCHWLYGFLFLAAGLQSPARGMGLLFTLWLGSLPWLWGFSLFGAKVKNISGHATWAARIVMFFVFLGIIAHQVSHSF